MQESNLILNRNEFGDPRNKGRILSPEEAKGILDEWVKNERLKVHMKQVAHLMKSYAACLTILHIENQKGDCTDKKHFHQ